MVHNSHVNLSAFTPTTGYTSECLVYNQTQAMESATICHPRKLTWVTGCGSLKQEFKAHEIKTNSRTGSGISRKDPKNP